jgi:hypothetical protein
MNRPQENGTSLLPLLTPEPMLLGPLPLEEKRTWKD